MRAIMLRLIMFGSGVVAVIADRGVTWNGRRSCKRMS